MVIWAGRTASAVRPEPLTCADVEPGADGRRSIT